LTLKTTSLQQSPPITSSTATGGGVQLTSGIVDIGVMGVVSIKFEEEEEEEEEGSRLSPLK
jgi:hypothetical protein